MDVAKVSGNEAPTSDELTAAADVLQRVLDEVGSGQIAADLDHAAYLRGAADTFSVLAGGWVKTNYSTTEPLADGIDLRTVARLLGNAGDGATLKVYAAWLTGDETKGADLIAFRLPPISAGA